MKQLERLTRKNREKQQEGPAKNAASALEHGDMDQVSKELEQLGQKLEKEEEKERLRRKQRDPKTSEEEKKKAQEDLEKLERESQLSRKDKEDLQKQLEEMKDQLERLSRNKEEVAKELKEMAERGEIDKEQLERELEQLEKNAEKLSPEEIKELAEALKECKECMGDKKSGDNGEGAGKKMLKAAQKAGQMGKEGENEAMSRKLVQIQQIRKMLSRSLGKNGPGGGRRPESKDKDDTATQEKFVPGELEKGKLEVVGHGPKGGFKGPRTVRDGRGDQASRPGSRLRRSTASACRPRRGRCARGYFEKVRGPDKKEEKKP